MSYDEIVEPVIGMPAPRHEVIYLPLPGNRLAAVEAAAVLELQQWCCQTGNGLASTAEQELLKPRLRQPIHPCHTSGPLPLDKRAHERRQPNQFVSSVADESNGVVEVG